MRETEGARYEYGYGEADRHPKAALQHGRRRLEMRADRLQHIHRGVAGIGILTGGDDRMPAEREGDIGHDAKGVVDVEPIEHLLDRPAGRQLLGRPSVEGRAMLNSRHLDGLKLWLGATLEHAGAVTERRDHGGDQLVALRQVRMHLGRVFVERTLDDVHDPLTLDEHLDERPVAPSRRDRTFAHHGICLPSLLHRRASGLLEA